MNARQDAQAHGRRVRYAARIHENGVRLVVLGDDVQISPARIRPDRDQRNFALAQINHRRRVEREVRARVQHVPSDHQIAEQGRLNRVQLPIGVIDRDRHARGGQIRRDINQPGIRHAVPNAGLVIRREAVDIADV